MAIFHRTQISCSCGNPVEVSLARSINASRSTTIRDEIKNGNLHKFFCDRCREWKTVERPMSYCDPARNVVFMVQPRGARYNHSRDGERIRKQEPDCTPLVSAGGATQFRVVYGLDELREKLVAQDAGYDDRIIELIKVMLIHEHPVLIKLPRLQLFLTEVTKSQLIFTAYYHNQKPIYEVRLPKANADSIVESEASLVSAESKARPRQSLFSKERRWVNFRRWSVRYSSLDKLKELDSALDAKKSIAISGAAFDELISSLPRGSQLPGWAKVIVQRLFNYAKAKKNGRAQDQLLEVRFGIELEDEWSRPPSRPKIDTIWKLLEKLPLENVEGNAKLREIQLVSDSGGLYDWEGIVEIGEGELDHRESFEDTLRHEVGHAVHAEKSSLVDGWLKNTFGWESFPATKQGFNQWVELMGGWKQWGNPSVKQKLEVEHSLFGTLGDGGRWEPASTPRFAKDHLWNHPEFGPRVAFKQSRSDWYSNCSNWYRKNGYVFYLNYWYAEFGVANEAAIELVLKMPDLYAAMSQYEFFAELYSLYYDGDDKQRKVIPKSVSDWLDRNIGNGPRRRRKPKP